MHGSRSINPLVGTALLVTTLALAIALAWPISQLIGGITESGATPDVILLQWLTDPMTQRVLLNTAAVTGLAVVLASLVALPGALLLSRHAAAVSGLLAVIGIVALTMPPLVTAIALDNVDDQLTASLSAPPMLGLAIVYALHYLPWLLFATWLTARRHAGPIDDTTRLLQVGRLTVMRRILLPAALPGWLFGVAMMALRIIEDSVTPQRLGIDDMLAPRLLAAMQDSGTLDSTVATLGLVLIMISMIVVVLTWRGLYRGTDRHPLDAHCRQHPAAPRRVHHWLGLLLLLALVLMPYVVLALHVDTTWVGHLRATGDSLVRAMLLPAMVCGLTLMISAVVLGGLTAYEHPIARFVHLLTWAILIIPTPVLAVLMLTDAGPGITPVTREAGTVLALALAVKLMPLAQVLVADRWRPLRTGLGELARVRRRGARRGGSGRLLSTLTPVLLATWCIGVIATLGDASTRAMLSPTIEPSLLLIASDGRAEAQAPAAAAALLLATMVGIMAAVSVRLLRGRRCRSLHHRRPRRTKQNSVDTQ
jgi:ABC-type Fe3+ transport system permease subunit